MLIRAFKFGATGGGVAETNSNVYFVDKSGNDSTGAVGNPTLPYLTAQAAYFAANLANEDCLIFFGIGSFGGITIGSNWNTKIRLGGVNSSLSLVGGITANVNLNIKSDRNVDLGNVDTEGNASPTANAGANGTDAVDAGGASIGGNGANGDDGGNGAPGGSVTLTNCICQDINTSGGNGGNGGAGGHAGVSGTTAITGANGGNGGNGGHGGDAGSVTLFNCTFGTITTVAGNGGDGGNGGAGAAGQVGTAGNGGAAGNSGNGGNLAASTIKHSIGGDSLIKSGIAGNVGTGGAGGLAGSYFGPGLDGSNGSAGSGGGLPQALFSFSDVDNITTNGTLTLMFTLFIAETSNAFVDVLNFSPNSSNAEKP